MSAVKEALQRYVDAVKLDMLDLFNKENLNVFEFRRISEMCETMIPLCNSAAGGVISHKVIADAMWEAEDCAPTLHQALGGHIFDADEMLQEKYRAMSQMHSDLRTRLALAKKAELGFEMNTRALAAQIENLEEVEAGLSAERRLLEMKSGDIERRELALASGGSSKQLSSGKVSVVEERDNKPAPEPEPESAPEPAQTYTGE
jgi:hypothetical protein